ncbi:uncharacterized protein BDZ99DRAFT_38921 [Mytilinidion resinicola]|uniref:Uncharacterized protein n=1 Tax=Mytilinidion resinicola TaxID=574789 RepID=A0A6A6YJL0_9PEZI|nr:uncharacterized protein BDZ99DRAFT_38921 [Mytilinidion resinicola]KAF2808749.1 hypothetical protein BDZ99DRAFT_38921 [Mytilinidion resinicola]
MEAEAESPRGDSLHSPLLYGLDTNVREPGCIQCKTLVSCTVVSSPCRGGVCMQMSTLTLLRGRTRCPGKSSESQCSAHPLGIPWHTGADAEVGRRSAGFLEQFRTTRFWQGLVKERRLHCSCSRTRFGKQPGAERDNADGVYNQCRVDRKPGEDPTGEKAGASLSGEGGEVIP